MVDNHETVHEASVRTYWLVFVALIALTGLTLWLSTIEMGESHLAGPFTVSWHMIVGMIIAFCKTLLVCLFFMHVLYTGSRLTWIVILGGLFFLGILMGLTLTDYLTRPWLVY